MKLTESAFWRLAAVIVTVNLLLMVVVVFFSIGTGPRIVDAYPPDGADQVSTLPTIRVTYRRALDTETLDNPVRLEPPADGRLEVDDHGFTFQPSHPLRPNTDYRLIVKDGIREVASGVTSRESTTSFHTRASRLVSWRRDGNAWALWTVDPHTEQQHMIVRGWESDQTYSTPPPVTTSPDGNKVAYIVPSPGPTWTLWIADLDDNRRRATLQDQPGIVSSVTWSPRGDLIAYEQSDVFGGVTTEPKIWIASPDSAETALVYGRAQETGSAPAWAPDGARLAFYENRLASLVIYSFTGTLQ